MKQPFPMVLLSQISKNNME